VITTDALPSVRHCAENRQLHMQQNRKDRGGLRTPMGSRTDPRPRVHHRHVAPALQHHKAHGSRRAGSSPSRSLHVCRTQLLFYPIQKHSRGFSSTVCIHPEYSGIFQCNYIECSSCRVLPNASVASQRGCVAREACKTCEELNPSRRSKQRGRTKGLFFA
jgi:hypothetical protein